MAKRILLADDSITIQKVVELTFSDGDYEVTAVNNGNKAIQKLSEMRPDIILSDIIMPEKNGYEVCEYVKSHPEFRNIPVILLTGTFEPFDPDRADKAGCDAVVTKPFESQSLIHKVEELIEHAKSQAPTGPVEAFAPEAPVPPPALPDAFATGTFQSHGEVFAGAGTASPAAPATETPFDQPPPAGETRAFPRMSFDDLKRMSNEPPTPPPPAPEPASPWDQPAPAGAETRAFPRMSFEDLKKAASEPPTPPPVAPPPPPTESTSPWDEPPATGGATRAFPRMSLDDLDKAPSQPPPPPSSPEPSPWDSGPRATSGAAETPPSPAESLPWGEQAGGFSGETRAFPRMTFDDLGKAASQAPAMPEPPPEPPSWPARKEAAAPSAPAMEELEFKHEPEAKAPDAPAQPAAAAPGELTDDQIDRIARRVVQLMSEQVVKNIAWEVIPDLAETVVKERIRQLESE